MDFRELSFGIELEFTGISRRSACKVIAEYFDTREEHLCDIYDTYAVTDSQQQVWKIMKDSSIKSQKKVGNSITAASDLFACEFVTPILYYDDIENLQEIIRKLRKAGAFTESSTCGIHIHISGKEFDGKHLRFLCNIFYSKANLFYSALRVEGQRLRYCKMLSEEFIRKLNEKKPDGDLTLFADIWYECNSSYSDSRSSHYNSSRYHGLNLHNLLCGVRQKTVEFRCFNSTLHAGEVKSYIQLCLLMGSQALNCKKASYKITVPTTGNEKYTLRVWLLHLGMISEEFATARQHLLKNLTGNIAWRDRV